MWQTLQNEKGKKERKKKTLTTNKFVCFGEGKLKSLEIKMNVTEVSEDKQRLMGNLKNNIFFFMA
jgi:hypothetical protein